MDKSFYNIFKIFFKIGTLLLGGGYVILPLLNSELADKKQWLTSEELTQYYALSSSLPGVIAINTSIFVGRKLAGRKGAIAAVFGVVLPSFLAIVILATALSKITDYKIVQNLFWGVGIGVVVLLFLAVGEMWKKCVYDKFSVFIYIICLLFALFLEISPAWIVIFAIFAGIVYQKFFEGKEGTK